MIQLLLFYATLGEKTLKEVYIDGASAGNPGPSGAGIFIKGNGIVERYSIPLGVMSNHEAEFHAFIFALETCLEKDYKVVSFRTDSELVNNAVEKEFVKNKLFAPLLQKALTLSSQFELFFMKWIPSSENKQADQLARAAIQKNITKGKNEVDT
jgi:ribonuclease HI